MVSSIITDLLSRRELEHVLLRKDAVCGHHRGWRELRDVEILTASDGPEVAVDLMSLLVAEFLHQLVFNPAPEGDLH
jgi:hypothetical protein